MCVNSADYKKQNIGITVQRTMLTSTYRKGVETKTLNGDKLCKNRLLYKEAPHSFFLNSLPPSALSLSTLLCSLSLEGMCNTQNVSFIKLQSNKDLKNIKCNIMKSVIKKAHGGHLKEITEYSSKS